MTTHLRECHIEPDWLLIYKIEANELCLYATATGTHADLFNM
ncbi:type II toxin-antitoxin system mRNA interferase toxin, RelE/StbE family [Thomasclavelia cocleata]